MGVEPKVFALGAAVVLAIAVFLGLILRPGLEANPPEGSSEVSRPTSAPPPAQLLLRYERRPGDSLVLWSAEDNRVLRRLGPGEGGFLRGILRPLERERARFDAPVDEPFQVVRTARGEVLLRDPRTELEMDLAAFGPTSVQLFVALLDGGPDPSVPPLIRR